MLKQAKETNQVSAAHIAALGQLSREAKTLCLFVLAAWGLGGRGGVGSGQQAAGPQQQQQQAQAQAQQAELAAKQQRAGLQSASVLQPAIAQQRPPRPPPSAGATSPYAAVSSYVGTTYSGGAPLPSAPAAGAVPPRVVPESVVDI